MTPDTLLLHLRVVGVLMAALVVINLCVPRHLRWREDMARVSLVNRQIFQAHTIFLILTLAMFSVLLLALGDALLEPTRLSRAILGGLTLFWGLRLIMQWAFYSPAIWRGDRFNTVVHYVFSAIWVYITGVFAVTLWSNMIR